jgi:F-type H+-transporting ATPase subunit alpha
VEQVRKFEAEMYRFVDNAHRPLLAKIVEKKTLDDALRAEIATVIKEFKERFVAEQPAATAHA